MTAHERWLLAICMDCTPKLPQPFLEWDRLTAWAVAHIDGTGHRVLLSTQEREVPTRCPFTHSHTRDWCGYETCREA